MHVHVLSTLLLSIAVSYYIPLGGVNFVAHFKHWKVRAYSSFLNNIALAFVNS